MKALLLIAHGSRRDASNREVIELADKLVVLAGNDFDLVKACFLELADPGIGMAVSECADLGVQHITVIPYFLSAGRHVAEDVPHELTEAAQHYRGMSITVCSHIGAISMMPDLLLGAAITGQQTSLEALVRTTDSTGKI
jgi:sirohydrochlorin ferrochelatase